MSQGTTETEAGGAAPTVGPLDVQLAVELDVTCGCPLGERDVEAIRQSTTRTDVDGDETCQVAVPDAGDDGAGYYERTTVEEACPCAIFEAHDCIADLESTREGSLYYSVVVPRRAVLRSIVEELRAIGAKASVERIHSGAVGDDAPSDDVALTEKQREALALAIESGYYDQPRGATLDDLAAELDVSRSAVSQRLTAIERKLVCERARDADVA